MGRGDVSAVSLVKRLLADLRLPLCQRIHREAGVAVAANIHATPHGETALGKSQPLLLRYPFCVWPGGFKAPGSLGYQRHSMSCISTQYRHTQQEGPDISLLDPALQKQWDHARNAHLGNTVIKTYSHRKVWWTCDKCPDGHLHSWSAAVNDRSDGNGCPQCSGLKVCKHNSLATRAPQAAAQWDYEANGGTPENVVAQSNQVFGWCCDKCGHKWNAAPHARIAKRNTSPCPSCATATRHRKHPTFADCDHLLLAEWDHDRNGLRGHRPDNVTLHSGKQIFWLCTKCPAGQEHSWPTSPAHRLGHSNTGCPFCARQAACRCNSLQALYPDIAAQWDPSKNKLSSPAI